MSKFFVGFLLALCLLIYALEMSGRWDQTLSDANDEASIVVIVLCVGVAVSVAGTLAAAILSLVGRSRRWITLTATVVRSFEHCPLQFSFATSPPLPLRI